MSSQKAILVGNATGKQGGGVVRHCLSRGFRVIALVRDPSSSSAQELAKLGSELAPGHFDDTESLRSAMKNVDTVFFHEVQTGDKVLDLQRVKNFVEAAKASPNVTMIITSTAVKTGLHESFPRWGPDHPMYSYWLNKHAIENLVRDSGIKHWTIVRPANFLQNTRPPIQGIFFPGFAEDLTLRVAYKPETKIPWIDCTDVGVVAADAMSSPSKLSGREIEFASEAITIQEFADKLTKALGSEVKVHYYSDDELDGLRKTSRAIGPQQWTNDVPGQDAADAAKEFSMTSVSSFLEANKDAIKGGA